MTTTMNVLRVALVAAMGWMACTATAGSVAEREFEADEDNLVSFHLEASFRHHASAAAVWFLEATHDVSVSSRQFKVFSSRFEAGTFAEFEYTYMDRETERTRIYYASSGMPEPFLGTIDAVPTHPYSTFLDIGPVVSHGEVRETNDTQLLPTPVDGDREGVGRANDAELKAVRTIERDIQANAVSTRRGRIVAYISQPMCSSCRLAVEQFAQRYDIDVTVNHLSREGLAAREFKRKRSAFMDTVRASIPGLGSRLSSTTWQPDDSGDDHATCGAIAVH